MMRPFLTGIIMDWDYIITQLPRFARATWLTLQLSFYSIIAAALLGLLVALVLMHAPRWARVVARAYVELSRNTPLLIQLFFLYYGLPKIGIRWDGYSCALIALTFLGGSYMAEAWRGGLEALPRSQIEAAQALALKPYQIFRYITLPQAWAMALPALSANVIFMIKESSVVNAVSVAELMFVTKDIIGMDYRTNEALFLLLMAYLIVLLPCSYFAHRAEKRARSLIHGA